MKPHRKMISAVLFAAALAMVMSTGMAQADVLYSNLGSGDSFSTAGYPSAQFVRYSQWPAVRFTVAGGDYQLGTVELPLKLGYAYTGMNVSVTRDAGGIPGTTLETILVPAASIPSTPRLVSVASVSKPVLEEGNTYWVVASFNESAEAQWYANNTGAMGMAYILVGLQGWFYSSYYATPALRVTGTPANSAPTLTAPSNITAVVGTAVAFTAAAFDPDAGDTLTFSLEGAPEDASIDPSSGEFTWTPTMGGDYTFIVKVTDAGGLSASMEVTVTVLALAVSDATIVQRGVTTIVTVMISNPSATDAEGIFVDAASLGGVDAATELPLVYDKIKPGASKRCTLMFKNAAPGDTTFEISGTCSLGDFFTVQAVSVP